jgi:hypothetical protein
MIEWYHIWLFTRIDSFKDYIGGVQVLFVIATIALGIGWFISNMTVLDYKDKIADGRTAYQPNLEAFLDSWAYKLFVKGKFRFFIILTAFMLPLINRMIPTQKEFAAIYLIPKVVNNESVQKIATNVGGATVNLSQVFLTKTEEWLKEQVAPLVAEKRAEEKK